MVLYVSGPKSVALALAIVAIIARNVLPKFDAFPSLLVFHLYPDYCTVFWFPRVGRRW